MALNIDELIAKLQATGTTGGVTINVINVNDDTVTSADATPVSDFKVGDRVMLCHVKKDGTGTKHTDGTVDSIGKDEFGPYVRVTGDNGKHYRCGLKMYEVRKGTQIIRKL
jgi:hypothetical protein